MIITYKRFLQAKQNLERPLKRQQTNEQHIESLYKTCQNINKPIKPSANNTKTRNETLKKTHTNYIEQHTYMYIYIYISTST